jgi:diguanylate cyclase (GGDEF)-like protein
MADAVAGVWARYRDTILARVDRLDAAAIALLEGRLDDDARRDAEREAHRLAGSVGTFGFAEGSRLAREAEVLLASPRRAQADALRLAGIAVALRDLLEASPPGAEAPAPPQPAGEAAEEAGAASGPRLLVVDDDAEFGERVAMEGAGRGMQVRAVRDLAAARAALARAQPTVVLLDPAAGDAAGARDLLGELAAAAPPVPVLVLSARDGFADRLAMSRAGVRGYLRKPLPPVRAVDAVEAMLAGARPPASTVLAVDDDPTVLEAVRAVLEPRGVTVHTLTEPLEVWERLEAVSPDVLLLDLDMPEVTGMEVCRVVRGDPRWSALPVIFLTQHTDPGTVERVFASGADDYVPKPFVGAELATRIANRMDRVRLQRSLAETDPLTGVANRRGSEEVLQRLIRLAAAQRTPFALAVVDLDRFKEVNDRHGHAAGDEVLVRVARLLQKRVSAEDVVARWGGEEFVLGIFGLDRQGGVQRLTEALELLRGEAFAGRGGERFRVTFSGGVAEAPGDGTDLASLYRAADAALYSAKEQGRDRILPTGWTSHRPDGPRMVDVAVVEDEAAIARLLLHALETHGHSHAWCQDGNAALRALVGPSPEMQARVVILDVDLPGVDGFGVLRAMEAAGVLERTRVIMLTVRSQEDEVLRALGAGAYDHVAKPFSVAVLLERVRRALEA